MGNEFSANALEALLGVWTEQIPLKAEAHYEIRRWKISRDEEKTQKRLPAYRLGRPA